MPINGKGWLKTDDNAWLVDPKDNLYQWIQKLSELLRFLEVLFIIDDIIANKDLDTRRQPLLELSIPGRHWDRYLWLLTQSNEGIAKTLREQAKAIFVWYPKARINEIHDENGVLTDNGLGIAREFFKKIKRCIFIFTK